MSDTDTDNNSESDVRVYEGTEYTATGGDGGHTHADPLDLEAIIERTDDEREAARELLVELGEPADLVDETLDDVYEEIDQDRI